VSCATRAHRNPPLDPGAQLRQVGQRVARQGGLDRDHAAADVDPHGRRNHRAGGGDHRPDRGPFAVVAVGHHRDVPEDEPHRRGVLDLLQRFGLDGFRRQEQDGLVVQSIHLNRARAVSIAS
jgi:hypothetical protein